MPQFLNDPVVCSTKTTSKAISGVSENQTPQAGPGVYGKSPFAAGVFGESTKWMGVVGLTNEGGGVFGDGGPSGSGVMGHSKKWNGVYGITEGIEGGPAGVWGEHKMGGVGVKATSDRGQGLFAYCESGEAIHATSNTGTGLVVHSESKEAIHATSKADIATIAAYNQNEGNGFAIFASKAGSGGEAIHAVSSTTGGVIGAYNHNEGHGFAIYAEKTGVQGFAGFFKGDVWVSGKLSVGNDIVLTNADCAEDFNIGNGLTVEPGTVMVLGEEDALFPCQSAYDKCVAGVVSGAGDYKPGIVLDKQESDRTRQPIALLGKVYCKVDAQYGAIEVGDMLTTSPVLGHAMKVSDPLKAFGAVIGKALRPLKEGQGLIPILIALQ